MSSCLLWRFIVFACAPRSTVGYDIVNITIAIDWSRFRGVMYGAVEFLNTRSFICKKNVLHFDRLCVEIIVLGGGNRDWGVECGGDKSLYIY